MYHREITIQITTENDKLDGHDHQKTYAQTSDRTTPTNNNSLIIARSCGRGTCIASVAANTAGDADGWSRNLSMVYTFISTLRFRHHGYIYIVWDRSVSSLPCATAQREFGRPPHTNGDVGKDEYYIIDKTY